MKEFNDKTGLELNTRNIELEKANETLRSEIAKRRNNEKELKNSYKQLRALTKHLESVREEERARISREVHDELGQSLTGLKIDLGILSDQLNNDFETSRLNSVNETIKKMAVIIDSNIQSVRRIAMELRPGILDDLGTIGAIEWQAQDFEKLTGIKCIFDSKVDDVGLDRESSTAIFRIFQEILTNVARHAEATRITIKFRDYRKKFKLEVADNGKGISEKDISAPHSLGLLGIKERALLFGGDVEIEGRHNKGTKISIAIPKRR